MGDDIKDDGLIRKQEEDYTKQVDEALPKAVALASEGKLHDAVESLLPLEKKARIANDSPSTTRLLEAVVSLCWDARDLKALGEYVTLLSKRRGQLKQAVTKMVQRACDCIDKVEDKEERIKLIELLRTVTAGKIHVELERARLTKKLADIREADGNISDAADILQDLQVETFGSMDKREKVEFILEQMRLGLLKKDYIRTQIISKKISTRFFKEENTHDLKLKYYGLMMQLAQNDRSYLDMAKYNREVYDTPQIQKDAERWQPVVRDTVFYLVLAPFGNEQSDLAARVREDKNLKQVPVADELLKVFSTNEVVQWKTFEAQFSEAVRSTDVFTAASEAGEQRWADLKKRLIEHNIRVIAQYYTRITLTRLQELLDLPAAQAEEYLSTLVTNKTIFAKIDRPAGIVSFSRAKAPADVLNEWASGISSLMRLVDKTTHLIAKERMVHKV